MRNIVICSFFALLTFSTFADARLANPSDLSSVSELERLDIYVDRRGHSKMLIERILRINNDEGRERESTQMIDFNSRVSKLKIIIARTLNGEKSSNVDKKNIEIKPVGDFSRYFDTQKKAKINFSNVQVGSKIHLKYEITVSEVPNEGFWSLLGDFNWYYLERYEATIRSELPLHTWRHDPFAKLAMNSKKVGKLHELSIRSTGPIALATIQEENAFIRPQRSVTFVVSTLASWQGYALPTVAFHEKLLQQKLPPTIEKITKQAAQETTVIDRLERAAALISQEFRYFGDWRRRNGGFVPRTLQEIEETRYGDCKDLSLVAVAIYRALGFKADLAWTIRGDLQTRPLPSWYTLPVDWFNHAVARVQSPDGQVFWIDATNPVIQAQAPPLDISGRSAFVLTAGGEAALDFIPELSSSSQHMEKRLTYVYQPDKSMKVTGELKLLGRAAIPMTVNAFYKPVESVNYELIRALSFGYKLRDYAVGDFPRNSRIVKDTTIPFQFHLSEFGVRTTAGHGFLLMRENFIDRVLEESRDRASDLFLESPGVWTGREEINGVRRVGKQTLDCDLKSEWLHASRRVVDSEQGVLALDRFEVLQPIIPNEALKTDAFDKFQTALRDCFFRAAIILEPR